MRINQPHLCGKFTGVAYSSFALDDDNALQPKTTRTTPAFKQSGFIVCCRKRTHAQGTIGYLSKRA